MTEPDADRPNKALPGNNPSDCSAVASEGQTAPTMLNALYGALESWRDVAEAVGGVSPALCWKVAHGKTKSNKIDQALGIPTQNRCKANGWHRRAVWIHEDDMPLFDALLARHGVRTLQELIDNHMIFRRRLDDD